MNTRNAIAMNYKKFPRLPGKKTNPIQTQNKPNTKPKQTQSSLAQKTRFATIERWLYNGVPDSLLANQNERVGRTNLGAPRKVVKKC